MGKAPLIIDIDASISSLHVNDGGNGGKARQACRNPRNATSESDGHQRKNESSAAAATVALLSIAVYAAVITAEN